MPGNKPIVPLGEWRPDIALLDNQFASDVENVLVGANSYMPLASLLPFPGVAGPLPELPCLGLTAARKSNGDWVIYAGSRTKLWKFTSNAWVDVSRTTGGAYAVPSSGELWSFAAFGSKLYAVQSADNMQVADINAGTAFADAPGSPPRAHKVTQLGDFLFLSGLMSPINRRKIIWSGINDPTQ